MPQGVYKEGGGFPTSFLQVVRAWKVGATRRFPGACGGGEGGGVASTPESTASPEPSRAFPNPSMPKCPVGARRRRGAKSLVMTKTVRSNQKKNAPVVCAHIAR